MKATAYDEIASRARIEPRPGGRDDRELVRLATLAASSHNTQPWRFECHPDKIWIRPDRSRRCPVVDPDDAHLYRSLGCAAENLIHAGSLQQLEGTARYDETVDAVVVQLVAAPGAEPTELSAALTTRQCTRTTYDRQPVSEGDSVALQVAGTGGGVECQLVTAAADMASIADLVDAGNRRQLTDGPFREELVRWLRFNPSAALRSRDGLAGRVNGQPPLPSALGRLLAPVFIRADQQVRTDRNRIESSAGIAAFTTETDSQTDWVAAGQRFERFALRADLLGIRTAFINQPIEVAELRPQLAAALSTSRSPQLLVRFGHAPYAPYSLRRAIDEVIIS